MYQFQPWANRSLAEIRAGIGGKDGLPATGVDHTRVGKHPLGLVGRMKTVGNVDHNLHARIGAVDRRKLFFQQQQLLRDSP